MRTLGINTDYVQTADFDLVDADKDFLIQVTYNLRYNKIVLHNASASANPCMMC